jgi:hypothetical protein
MYAPAELVKPIAVVKQAKATITLRIMIPPLPNNNLTLSVTRFTLVILGGNIVDIVAPKCVKPQYTNSKANS